MDVLVMYMGAKKRDSGIRFIAFLLVYSFIVVFLEDSFVVLGGVCGLVMLVVWVCVTVVFVMCWDVVGVRLCEIGGFCLVESVVFGESFVVVCCSGVGSSGVNWSRRIGEDDSEGGVVTGWFIGGLGSSCVKVFMSDVLLLGVRSFLGWWIRGGRWRGLGGCWWEGGVVGC